MESPYNRRKADDSYRASLASVGSLSGAPQGKGPMGVNIPLDVWVAGALCLLVVSAAIFEQSPTVFFVAYGMLAAVVVFLTIQEEWGD